jgi:hypothetical protein
LTSPLTFGADETLTVLLAEIPADSRGGHFIGGLAKRHQISDRSKDWRIRGENQDNDPS